MSSWIWAENEPEYELTKDPVPYTIPSKVSYGVFIVSVVIVSHSFWLWWLLLSSASFVQYIPIIMVSRYAVFCCGYIWYI